MLQKKTRGFNPGSDQRKKGLGLLEPAVNAIRRGECIVYPTETLYGLGADARNDHAVLRLISLKGREAGKPISILVSDEEMLREVAGSISETALILMRRFWPGPLTLVLPASDKISHLLIGPKRAIGVRISSHPVAQALVKALQSPITTTSANPAGRIPATSVKAARDYFGDAVTVYVDGGPLKAGQGSSVVEVISAQWKMIREGAISSQEISLALATP